MMKALVPAGRRLRPASNPVPAAGAALALALAWAAVSPTRSAESPVRAELRVPPAETYVIGDTVPLLWRFENLGAAPLAFLWEGCCRLNGRLTVTRASQPLTPVPPGQALAHMFAKAERLDPGTPRDFETRLSDWVDLRDTGTYELRGRYTGVLPDQHPQIPKGLVLWRDAAHTPPITVDLLSPDDYGRQRTEREGRRGLRLEISTARSLPPLGPTPLKLKISNPGTHAQTIDWPDSLSLWILDARGRRVTAGGTAFEGPFAPWTIPPGGVIERDLPFGAERVEGEPFGTYRVFIDLAAAGPTQPRVPSNVAEIDWNLDRAAVVELITQASSGARTGARNAPLKLLRLYVAELGPVFAAVPPGDLKAEAAPLLGQLRAASCLKPIAPKPGRIDIALRLAPDGTVRFDDDRLARCLAAGGDGLADQLARVLQLRRHLGWDVGLVLLPAPGTTVARTFQAGGTLRALQAELAGPVRLRAAPSTNLLTGALAWAPPGPTADLTLVLHQGPERLTAQVAQAAGNQPGTVRDCAGPEELERLLSDAALTAPRCSVLADPRATMDAVFHYCEPLLRRGLQVSFVQSQR